MKKLPIRWSFKKGDKILYKTPKGKVKTFIYGKQTWYKDDLPKRHFRYFRGKLEYRQPEMHEIMSRTLKKWARKITAAVYDDSPLYKLLSQRKAIDGGVTFSTPIVYKNSSR